MLSIDIKVNDREVYEIVAINTCRKPLCEPSDNPTHSCIYKVDATHRTTGETLFFFVRRKRYKDQLLQLSNAIINRIIRYHGYNRLQDTDKRNG